MNNHGACISEKKIEPIFLPNRTARSDILLPHRLQVFQVYLIRGENEV